MEQTQLQAVWAQILDKMKEQLAPTAFNWLNPVEPLSLSNDTLELGTQTEMAKEWIAGHYQTLIEDAARACGRYAEKSAFAASLIVHRLSASA